MIVDRTPRGFEIIVFEDRTGARCSLQQSLIASEPCLWLGKGDERMHLAREHVADLYQHLGRWLGSGSLLGLLAAPLLLHVR